MLPGLDGLDGLDGLGGRGSALLGLGQALLPLRVLVWEGEDSGRDLLDEEL